MKVTNNYKNYKMKMFNFKISIYNQNQIEIIYKNNVILYKIN